MDAAMNALVCHDERQATARLRWSWRGCPVAAHSVLAFLLLTALASACTGGDRSAVAAAECAVPVAERLGVPAGERVEVAEVGVVALDDGRYRVTGIALAGRGGIPAVMRDGREFGTAFRCVVAPDPSDDVRGLTVTQLEVGRTVAD